jgi:hypothetical protein
MVPVKHCFVTAALIVVIFALLASGCADAQTATSTPSIVFISCDLSVDPLFREFYFTLGGQEMMGCAISPVFEQDGITSQYTEAGLLRYNPTQPTSQQFSLAPLGKQSKLADPPLAIEDQEDPPVLDGMIIFDRFVSRFKLMGGTRFVGRPISQPVVDRENDRIIQFFENVIFYTSASDTKDRAHLLRLGTIFCEDICPDLSRGLDAIGNAQYSEPYLKEILRVGTDLTGKVESNYYRTTDGYIEQIYTNVVIRAALLPPYRVILQPVPVWINYYDATLPYFQPAARVDDDGLIFNKLPDSELGFNEAVIFEQFVATHGSKAMSGAVTSQIFEVDKVYRQCYVNYCLDYDPETQTIRPAPLGLLYLKLRPPEQAAKDNLVLKPSDVLLRVVETRPLISSDEQQKVTVQVFQKGDQYPIPNLDAILTLTLPDGSETVYTMAPTNTQGKTSLLLKPILAANGTLIPFKVCLFSSSTPICSKETFTIWGNP